MRVSLSLGDKSRLAGLLLLLATVALYLSQSVMGDIRVDDSFAATATNMLSRPTAYRAVFAINLVGVALTLAGVTLLDELLHPVDPRLSRLAALLALIGCVAQAFLNVFLYGAGAMVHGIPYKQAFYARQFQALGHLLLVMYREGCFVALLFFALYVIVVTYVTTTSLLLPHAVYFMVVVFGCGVGVVMWLAPATLLGDHWRRSVVFILGGQLALSITLLAMGLNPERWKEAVGLPARLVA
jgi:hypothetical protein